MTSPSPIPLLCRKYRAILGLRRAVRLGQEEARRAGNHLAAEFPGALREADDLPIHVIEARLDELGAAEHDPALVAPWMLAMARFHVLARGALAAKRWLAGRKTVDAELRRSFEADHVDDAASEWAGRLERLAKPTRGRLSHVVFEVLAVELGCSLDEARRLVFGGGRLRDTDALD